MSTAQAQPTVTRLPEAEQIAFRSESLLRKAVRRILRDRLTMAALSVLVIMALLAVFAPVICRSVLRVDPFKVENLENYKPVGTPGNILGTDGLGRDHLGRLLYGAQVSLGVAFLAATLSLTIGVLLGVITGYYGGIADDVVIWLVTTLNSIPTLYLLLIIGFILRPFNPGPTVFIVVLGLLSWTGTTRLVRGETLSLREREFIVGARAMGASSWRIMFAHILPNVISVVIITLALDIGALILIESALSFLNFGISPSTPSWGNMLTDSTTLIRKAPHLIIAPGLLIAITVLCTYILGDGIRDAFDPTTVD